ncbi:uncharacterized protein TNCV_728661 [Trichonephila clavipes]|nr:uncharacterized protein TNCV_728661 [Trichonephila clavipes]
MYGLKPGESFSKFFPPLPESMNDSIDKSRRENEKRRKQKDPKRKAAEPPPEVTESDKCRRHKEIQKRIKMTNGRLSFLEHCIQSEKEFPDLTDDDALVGFKNEHDELSSLKEQDLDNVNGFVSPQKTAKKLKLSDPIAGTSRPVSVQNKFSGLAEEDAEMTPTTSSQTAAPISARPKVPPIMFKHKKANYKQIKNLNRDFPDCDVKLAGKYLKIFCKSSDEHRIVTEYLKGKSEEFYVIDPPDSRPLKIVIKDSRFPQKSTGLEAKREEFVYDALIYAKSLYEELEISFETSRRIGMKHIFDDGGEDDQLSYEDDLRRTMFPSIDRVIAEIREKFQQLQNLAQKYAFLKPEVILSMVKLNLDQGSSRH